MILLRDIARCQTMANAVYYVNTAIVCGQYAQQLSWTCVNRPRETTKVLCGGNYSTWASEPICSYPFFREIKGESRDSARFSTSHVPDALASEPRPFD